MALPTIITTDATPDSPSSPSGLVPDPLPVPVPVPDSVHVHADPLLSNEPLPRLSEEVGLETMIEQEPAAVSIHTVCQRGDARVLEQLFKDDPSINVNARDSQDVTPLHWAAINAHIAVCRWLLDHGADVDAIGGELRATPLQWAARNGHLYAVHLLLARGADPNIHDAQGFNTLHLVTHSSGVMALLYMLQQPLAVDEKDADGHTALMWAAYQGDALSVDLLLRHGASVHARDSTGLTPLHWAVVKGSPACIKHLVLAGADVEAREEQNKSPRDMAQELKSLVPFTKGLEDANFSPDGIRIQPRLSERTTTWVIFALPTVVLLVVFKTFEYLPFYVAFPLMFAQFAVMHLTVVKVLLAHQPLNERVAASPYFAAIIIASIIWVGWCWATRLVLGTPGFLLTNLAFLICLVACSASLYSAMRTDPGFIPKAEHDSEIKEVIEDLVDSGRLNGTNFCIMCMARKPLRSKHCRTCNRCVARFDHHCPWIWNCVGYKNHRPFLLFVLFLIGGICLFNRLTVAYIDENAPEYEPPAIPTLSTCDISTVLCRGTGIDTFLVAVALWATLQLTWTIILAVSHLWQVARQMTTFEVSNLGRYGFMGGRGGQSLRDQTGALRQGGAVGLGLPPLAGGGGGVGGGDVDVDPSALGPGHVHGPNCKHGQGGGHGGHARGIAGIGRMCGALFMTISGPMLKILGLDRFTKGKAVSGMARAGREQNPFDLGFVKNCTDFWMGTPEVDYVRLYEVPAEGWMAYRRKLAVAGQASMSNGKGYIPVSREEV